MSDIKSFSVYEDIMIGIVNFNPKQTYEEAKSLLSCGKAKWVLKPGGVLTLVLTEDETPRKEPQP